MIEAFSAKRAYTASNAAKIVQLFIAFATDEIHLVNLRHSSTSITSEENLGADSRQNS